MLDLMKRNSVDLLVDQFWKNGYLTISRKFGIYLPEPQRMGGFDVDIIARYKKDYAIGITLNEEDMENPELKEKIKFLATRQTKFTNKRVILFIGISHDLRKKIELIINTLDENVKKNIKIQSINSDISLSANTKKKSTFLN
ncbi:MAG: hypothetical protein P4L27_12705 [Ignavibacteriaceae bacterium]|nr:hypothetical protein [Ignavibacteriaceae bacterium]